MNFLAVVVAVPGLLSCLCSVAVAQVERYELGLRLRACERRLAATTEPARRVAALGEFDRAVQAFFRLDTAAVARAIDAADRALVAAPADDASRYAQSVQLVLARRLHDASTGTLPFELSLAYDSELPCPEGLQLEISVAGEKAPRLQVVIKELPLAGELRLTDAALGDQGLQWTLRLLDRVLATRTQGLSLAEDLAARLGALEAAAKVADEAPRDIETASLPTLVRLLRGMTRARAEETILPGARLLEDAESLVTAIGAGQPFHGPARAGEHWLRVPVGKRNTTLRLLVPPATDGATARPLVIALHGAGGSENLFFDGYGDGAIVPLCRERGWFLAAPRGEMFGSADLPGLIDALAVRWPIDTTRVLLVGHSMGAAQAIAVACQSPERFRAVAALGGGGNVGRSAQVTELPFFVGVGERDFARRSAQALHRALNKAGAPTSFREYADVEHLAIVQFALPDVFTFFTAALDRK